MKILLLGDENLTFSWGFVASHPEDEVEVGVCLAEEQLKDDTKPLLDKLREKNIVVHFHVNPAQMKASFGEDIYDEIVYIYPGLAFHGVPGFIEFKSEMFRLRLHLFCFGFLKSVKSTMKSGGDVYILWPSVEDESVPFSQIDMDKLAKFCYVQRGKGVDTPFDSKMHSEWRPLIHNIPHHTPPEWVSHSLYYQFHMDEESKSEKQKNQKKTPKKSADKKNHPEEHPHEDEPKPDDFNILKIPPQIFNFDRTQLPHVNECFHFKLWGKNSQAFQISKLTLKYDPRISGWKGDGTLSKNIKDPQNKNRQTRGGKGSELVRGVMGGTYSGPPHPPPNFYSHGVVGPPPPPPMVSYGGYHQAGGGGYISTHHPHLLPKLGYPPHGPSGGGVHTHGVLAHGVPPHGGVHTPGVHTPGVHTPGVHTPGVHTPGVHTPGVPTPHGAHRPPPSSQLSSSPPSLSNLAKPIQSVPQRAPPIDPSAQYHRPLVGVNSHTGGIMGVNTVGNNGSSINLSTSPHPQTLHNTPNNLPHRPAFPHTLNKTHPSLAQNHTQNHLHTHIYNTSQPLNTSQRPNTSVKNPNNNTLGSARLIQTKRSTDQSGSTSIPNLKRPKTIPSPPNTTQGSEYLEETQTYTTNDTSPSPRIAQTSYTSPNMFAYNNTSQADFYTPNPYADPYTDGYTNYAQGGYDTYRNTSAYDKTNNYDNTAFNDRYTSFEHYPPPPDYGTVSTPGYDSLQYNSADYNATNDYYRYTPGAYNQGYAMINNMGFYDSMGTPRQPTENATPGYEFSGQTYDIYKQEYSTPASTHHPSYGEYSYDTSRTSAATTTAGYDSTYYSDSVYTAQQGNLYSGPEYIPPTGKSSSSAISASHNTNSSYNQYGRY